MRGCFTLSAAAVLLSLPVLAEVAPASAEQECSVCTELLENAQHIDRILRSVRDRESADKAAEELRTLFDRMQKLCRQLEKLPVSTPEEARELSGVMRSLTHIFQGCIPVVERLMEVNAYGSDSLVGVFHLYKVREGYTADSGAEDSPVIILWQEWAEAMEEVVYHVRKLNSAEDINSRLPMLEQLVQRVEQCRSAARSADVPDSPEVLNDSRSLLEGLHRELRDECSRLQSAGVFTEALSDLLVRCHL